MKSINLFIFISLLVFGSYSYSKTTSISKISPQCELTIVLNNVTHEEGVMPVMTKDFFVKVELDQSPEYVSQKNELLIEAIKAEEIELACELIRANADVNIQDEDGYTPLMHAVRNENIDMVKLLLFHPDANPNIQSKIGMTALIASVLQGSTSISNLLLSDARTDINLAEYTYGYNALSWAIARDRFSVVTSIINRSDWEPNPRIMGTEPVIMLAAIKYWKLGNERVNKILSNPDLDINAQDADGETALISASRGGRLDLVNKLLAKPGIDVNLYMFRSGETALAAASRFGHLSIVNALLKVPGVKINNEHIAEHWGTPLSGAAYNGHIHIVERLLKVDGIDVNTLDGDRKSAYYWARETGHEEIAEMIRSSKGFYR